MDEELITVEVAYAPAEQQFLVKMDVPSQTTLAEVIQLSSVISEFPEIDLNTQKVGIFGQLANLTQLARHGDRIEIYRPLKIDPMDARRQKAR